MYWRISGSKPFEWTHVICVHTYIFIYVWYGKKTYTGAGFGCSASIQFSHSDLTYCMYTHSTTLPVAQALAHSHSTAIHLFRVNRTDRLEYIVWNVFVLWLVGGSSSTRTLCAKYYFICGRMFAEFMIWRCRIVTQNKIVKPIPKTAVCQFCCAICALYVCAIWSSQLDSRTVAMIL